VPVAVSIIIHGFLVRKKIMLEKFLMVAGPRWTWDKEE